MLVIAVFVFSILGLPLSSSAQEPVSEAGVRAVINTLKYVRGLEGSGDKVRLGIIYNSSSRAEADKFAALLKAQKAVSGVGTIEPIFISAGNLGAAANVDALYVTRGLSSHYSRIASVAESHRVFSISFDNGCAQSGCCVVSINTEAGIEITLNESAMQRYGFDVDAAFKYMAVRI